MKMRIEKEKVGVLTYTIQIENEQGELIEEASAEQPKTMVFGTGRLLEAFESRLEGMQTGDTFHFTIPAEEAFGAYRPELVMDLPKSTFAIQGKLRDDLIEEGKDVKMMDSQGNPFTGRVLYNNGETVKMDFNHPLAGKSLCTKGEILHIREATTEELNPSSKDACCGGGCGCGEQQLNQDHENKMEDNCTVCGNPPELQGQGHGKCQCV